MSFFDSMPLMLAQDSKATDGAGTDAPLPKEAPKTTQTTGKDGAPLPPPGQQQRAPGGMDNTFLIVLFVGLLLMIVFSMRAQKREKKKRESMLETLKKGDKVQSIGGILGTIVEVRPDRIIVKVDENTNTRLSFARSAIQGIVGDQPAEKKEEPAIEKKD